MKSDAPRPRGVLPRARARTEGTRPSGTRPSSASSASGVEMPSDMRSIRQARTMPSTSERPKVTPSNRPLRGEAGAVGKAASETSSASGSWIPPTLASCVARVRKLSKMARLAFASEIRLWRRTSAEFSVVTALRRRSSWARRAFSCAVAATTSLARPVVAFAIAACSRCCRPRRCARMACRSGERSPSEAASSASRAISTASWSRSRCTIGEFSTSGSDSGPCCARSPARACLICKSLRARSPDTMTSCRAASSSCWRLMVGESGAPRTLVVSASPFCSR